VEPLFDADPHSNAYQVPKVSQDSPSWHILDKVLTKRMVHPDLMSALIPVPGLMIRLTSARKEYIVVKARACTVRRSCLLSTSSRYSMAAVKYAYGKFISITG